MANKRYYWLKLYDDFFSSLRIKKLRKLAGGDTYLAIYLKMQLLAMKSDGILKWSGLEDDFTSELALELDEEPENIKVTLAYLLSCGLAETDDSINYFFPFAVSNVGSESTVAQRVRDYRKKAKEEAVIERIKDIRTAERAFKSKYQHFTGDFDTLINFVLNDSIEGQRRIVDEDDSVAMAQLKKAGKKNIETFTVAVIDTIFAPKKLSPDQVKNFRYIPGTNKQAEFTIAAGMVTTESKVVVPVVEVKAPYVKFLDTVTFRQEVINLIKAPEVVAYDKYPGIKFGSMEGANNEAGNWE